MLLKNLSKQSSGILNFRIVGSKNGSDRFLSGHSVICPALIKIK